RGAGGTAPRGVRHREPCGSKRASAPPWRRPSPRAATTSKWSTRGAISWGTRRRLRSTRASCAVAPILAPTGRRSAGNSRQREELLEHGERRPTARLQRFANLRGPRARTLREQSLEELRVERVGLHDHGEPE